MPSHFPPWVSWHSEVLAFFALLLLAWQGALSSAKNGTLTTLVVPHIAIPLMVATGLIWLQAAIGTLTFFGDALVLTIYIALCFASLMLGRAASCKSEAYIALAFTLSTGAFFSAIVAFVQVFDIWENASWINRMQQLRRPGGNIGQPNQLATLLLMGVASLLFLYEKKKVSVSLFALLSLILLAGLAATESRTGILSFSALMGWWFFKRKSLGFALSPWVVLVAATGFLGMFFTWPQLINAVQASGAPGTVNISAGSRWMVWSQLMDAVWMRPWTGWGLGRISDAQNAVAHVYEHSETFTYAHNILLDLVLGAGIPLTLLIGVVTVVWLLRRISATQQLTSWYCLAVVLPVAVHSMLEFPFAYAYFLVPVMLALGALDGLAGTRPAFHLSIKPVFAMLMMATALMAWSVVEYLAIEEDFRIVRFEALRVGQTPANYERPKVILLTQLDALLHGGRIVPKPGMSTDELTLAKNVALRFPWPATQNRYALSLALNGNSEEAMRQMRVMRALHGADSYRQIKQTWTQLGTEKYPELLLLKLP